MSIVINSPNTFLGASLHSHVRGTTNWSAGRGITMTARALAGIKSNRSDGSKERVLQRSLSTFFDKTLKLQQSLNSFSSSTGHLPHLSRTVSVSDVHKVTAQVVSGATPDTYEIAIDRLATTQTNRSKALASGETTDLDEGTYGFTLTVGDTSYSLSITVDKSGAEPDTNKDVLEKLAYEISSADDDIEAFVTETERKVYSTLSDNLVEDVVYLTVRNKNTGNDTRFSLSDDTGTIIDTLYIDHVAESGQTCQYHLNGTRYTSNSNTVLVDNNRLTMGFLDTTAAPITITVKGGLDATREKLTDLIFAYNDYVSWLDQNREHITPAVKADMIKEIDSISKDVHSIGVELNANGNVYITEKLGNALRSDMGTVRKTLTGENGFFTKVCARLSEILENEVAAYGIDQSRSSTYNRKGLFESLKRINAIGLYA